jgi:hypothetical protein
MMSVQIDHTLVNQLNLALAYCLKEGDEAALAENMSVIGRILF